MVKPLDLQVFARVEQIAGELQLEEQRRMATTDALSDHLGCRIAERRRIRKTRPAREGSEGHWCEIGCDV